MGLSSCILLQSHTAVKPYMKHRLNERGSISRFWPSSYFKNKKSKHPWSPHPPFSPPNPHQSSRLILQNYRLEHSAPAVSKQVSTGAVDFRPEAPHSEPA